MNLRRSVTISVVAGAVGAGLVFAFALDAVAQTSALIGVLAGTAVSVASLMLKAPTQKPVAAPTVAQASAEFRSAMANQGLSFGLRLVALLVGAFALRRQGLDPMSYVLAFFGCYVVQHLVEMRYVLGARSSAAGEGGR